MDSADGLDTNWCVSCGSYVLDVYDQQPSSPLCDNCLASAPSSSDSTEDYYRSPPPGIQPASRRATKITAPSSSSSSSSLSFGRRQSSRHVVQLRAPHPRLAIPPITAVSPPSHPRPSSTTPKRPKSRHFRPHSHSHQYLDTSKSDKIHNWAASVPNVKACSPPPANPSLSPTVNLERPKIMRPSRSLATMCMSTPEVDRVSLPSLPNYTPKQSLESSSSAAPSRCASPSSSYGDLSNLVDYPPYGGGLISGSPGKTPTKKVMTSIASHVRSLLHTPAPLPSSSNSRRVVSNPPAHSPTPLFPLPPNIQAPSGVCASSVRSKGRARSNTVSSIGAGSNSSFFYGGSRPSSPSPLRVSTGKAVF